MFEQPGLFRRFADLAESENACAEFASRFGSHRKRSVYVLPPWNPEKLQRWFDTAIQDPFIAGVALGLDWDIDIRKLRSVLKLHDAIASADLGVIDKGYGEQFGVPVSYAATTDALGVILPSNSPAVNALWMPSIILKIPVLLKPGREEPWTPWRVIQAFIRAGCPPKAFSFYPTGHDGGVLR